MYIYIYRYIDIYIYLSIYIYIYLYLYISPDAKPTRHHVRPKWYLLYVYIPAIHGKG